MGPQGLKGDTGTVGPVGATGVAGPVGPQGLKGDAGATGPAGATGSTGSQGLKGDTGTVGPAGATGAAGPVGSQGPKGDTGTAGPAGTTGAAGPVGPQGLKGDTGTVGPAGATGAAGPVGSQGPKGDTGTVGPEGATGPRGLKGDAGANGRTLWNGFGPPQANIGVAGDFYLDTQAHHLHGPMKEAGWQTTTYVSVIGPQGVPGPAGPSDTAAVAALASELDDIHATICTLSMYAGVPVSQQPPDCDQTQSRYQPMGTNGEIIKDLVTGLEWQRCSVGQTWDAANQNCGGTAATYDWNTAKDLTTDGGFRIPTKDELKTLVYCSSWTPVRIGMTDDFTSCPGSYDSPTIVSWAFPDTEEVYWSGSLYTPNPAGAWFVHFDNGSTDAYFQDVDLHVRLVRSGQ
ncbi:DUF1566 domain-containing protein [Thiocystis minor]|uniref:Lcl domain-containing protein n=1 Tax=Thiocystis minor TaxID=61597 RepID=UPI001F5D37F9|nr:DUF1566 domain-containing protein [Thiocystis minor]